MSKLIVTGSLSQELKGVCSLVALFTPGPKQHEDKDGGMLVTFPGAWGASSHLRWMVGQVTSCPVVVLEPQRDLQGPIPRPVCWLGMGGATGGRHAKHRGTVSHAPLPPSRRMARH